MGKSPGKGFGWPAQTFENMGKGMVDVLTKAPKEVAGGGKAFFSGENSNNLTNVQYVYLAVACAGAAVRVLFFFAKLPEVEEQAVRRGSIITEETLEVGVDQYGNVIGDGPLWKQYNMICGFIAQFWYVS